MHDIRQYFDENGILVSVDYDIKGNNVYLTDGQGCGTIWFKSTIEARKAFKQDGILRGSDLFNCTKCRCHYSFTNDLIYFKYLPYRCSRFKRAYAKQFEKDK